MAVRELGYALTAFSAAMGVLAYFVLGLRPLAYSMIGIAVVGLTAIAVGGEPRPSGASLRSMVEALAVNVEALLEEVGVYGRAVFMPPRDGLVVAFVPERDPADPASLASSLESAPLRLMGAVAGVRGVAVLLPEPELESRDVEGSVRKAVVEDLELAEAVRVRVSGDVVTVEAVRPRARALPRFDSSLSPLPTAVAASVIAKAVGRPVRLERAYSTPDGVGAEFRILGT